jgi:hypothetical protein
MSSPKPEGQFPSNFVQINTLMMGIQVCANQGQGLLQRGDNYKNRMGLSKSSLKPLDQKSSDLYENFLIKCKLKFDVGRGHNRENNFQCVYIGKIS